MDLTTLLASGGFKSVQTGWQSSPTLSSGSGEDAAYTDITISAVDTTKAVPWVEGGLGVQYNNGVYLKAGDPFVKAFALGSSTGSAASYSLTCRLINSTTLRVSGPVHTSFTGVDSASMRFRWTVLESK